MANAEIVVVGPDEFELVAGIYNQVLSPPVDGEFLHRRFLGRRNVGVLLAVLDQGHVGFDIGFELTPSTYFGWLCGVLPDFRRLGIATQLQEAQQAWAREHHYSTMRFECQNQHRPMLHVAINQGYDLVGIRWDTTTAGNVVIFEKDLR